MEVTENGMSSLHRAVATCSRNRDPGQATQHPKDRAQGEGWKEVLALLLGAGSAGVHAARTGPRRLRASGLSGWLQPRGPFRPELGEVVL